MTDMLCLYTSACYHDRDNRKLKVKRQGTIVGLIKVKMVGIAYRRYTEETEPGNGAQWSVGSGQEVNRNRVGRRPQQEYNVSPG